MFGDLPASRPTRSFRKGEWTGLLGAAMLHAGLLLLGGSSTTAPAAVEFRSDTTPIIFPRGIEDQPRVPERSAVEVVSIPQIRPETHWPMGAVPDLDLSAASVAGDLSIEPSDVFGRRRPGPSVGAALDAASRLGGGGFVREDVLDLPLRVWRAPEPHYPEWLRRAGISGAVTVEFVVDTDGTVERASIDVIRADRQEFVDAVLRSLERARFSPGTVRGRPVRVKVRQDFRFRIGQ